MSPPRYVFIGGLHRSGTSLLHRCLAAHPEVTSFAQTGVPEDEGQHLQDALPTARMLGGPGRFARHPLAASEPVPSDAAAGLRARLLATWDPLWRHDAAVRLAKSPPDLLRGPLLLQLFPGSVLLIIRRHPIAVAFATRAMARGRRALDPLELIEHWLIAHERFDAQRVRLPGLVELRLEELAARPLPVLDRVFVSCGLTRPRELPVIRTDPDAPYRLRWSIWRRTSAPRRLTAVLERLQPRALAQGYDLLRFVVPGKAR